MRNNTRPAYSNVPSQWYLISLSAQLVKEAVSYGIERLCAEALKGRTPNEPRPDSVSLFADLETHGFHEFKGTVWGLHKQYRNGREVIELCRLLDLR